MDGKGMNAARQISRRFGRTKGVRTRFAADYSITATISVVPDPLKSNINDMHTFVPGPDGKFGYGGKCFPKDVNAFTILTQGTPLGSLLTPLHTLNVHFRGVEERI